MQGFEYFPPQGMENIPMLQPTNKPKQATNNIQSQQINPELGEQQIQIPTTDQAQQQQQQQTAVANQSQ